MQRVRDSGTLNPKRDFYNKFLSPRLSEMQKRKEKECNTERRWRTNNQGPEVTYGLVHI